jgi:hypothetical protein
MVSGSVVASASPLLLHFTRASGCGSEQPASGRGAALALHYPAHRSSCCEYTRSLRTAAAA